MTRLTTYTRPSSVAEALQLLARPGAVPLAGGTRLVARLGSDEMHLVDLQAAGLTQVADDGDRITLGAMVRLQTLVEHPAVPPLVRQMAHREGPNTVRQAGTLGGAVASADRESELLAALLVHNATVIYQTMAEEQDVSLATWLTEPGRGLITAVALETSGETAAERVARTPADRPIVAAVGRRSPDGAVRLALCGVARTAVLVSPDAVDRLEPPADFRGTGEYRLQMAQVLSRRVLAQLA